MPIFCARQPLRTTNLHTILPTYQLPFVRASAASCHLSSITLCTLQPFCQAGIIDRLTSLRLDLLHRAPRNLTLQVRYTACFSRKAGRFPVTRILQALPQIHHLRPWHNSREHLRPASLFKLRTTHLTFLSLSSDPSRPSRHPFLCGPDELKIEALTSNNLCEARRPL